VLDFDAPSSRLALDQFRQPIVRERLMNLAKLRTGSEFEADDLVANALLLVLDPDGKPWVPELGPFLAHMDFLMRWLRGRQIRKAQVQQGLLHSGVHRSEYTPAPRPPPDHEVERELSIAFWQSLLEVVLAEIGDKYPLTRRLCELEARGIDEPADQARIIGCKVQDVYRTLETLQYHAKRVFDAWELAEERRMKDLQEGAAKQKDEVSA
jgi:DNA-directed RNA polymerase specialized sigma24 family protein